MSCAVIQMEKFLESPTHDNTKALWSLLKQIDELQGDDRRNVSGTQVHGQEVIVLPVFYTGSTMRSALPGHGSSSKLLHLMHPLVPM
jgi:hypothetical protein